MWFIGLWYENDYNISTNEFVDRLFLYHEHDETVANDFALSYIGRKNEPIVFLYEFEEMEALLLEALEAARNYWVL